MTRFNVILIPICRSPKDIWRLRLHFASFAYISEAALAVYGFRKEKTLTIVAGHVFTATAQTFFFHQGLKMRAAIGRLPDEDLEKFLVDTLFKGGFQTLFSILFLLFRVSRCLFEKGSMEECTNTSLCSMFISIYLLFWWGTQSIQGSVKSEWQRDLNLSIEKIARMKDISARRGAAGVLQIVTGVCGIFLFSTISAKKVDTTTIFVVGVTGTLASFGVCCSEIYSTSKAQTRMTELSDSGRATERVTENEEPVEECSWVFEGVSFLFTSTYSFLCVCYAVTLDGSYWLMAYVILPMAFISWAMVMCSRPKRTGSSYNMFLYFHFFSFGIVGEVGIAGGMGWVLNGLFFAICVFAWGFAFMLFWKLRASAAKLPPQELSEFLCQTVLIKGAAAMGPMFFFSFETVSCFFGQDFNINNGQCTNTAYAAVFLSIYFALLTIVSMTNKSVPKSVQRETAWELSAIATLNLKWWQQLQGGLMAITVISSLYLLSWLGVASDLNILVGAFGGLGTTSLCLATLISAIMLPKTRAESGEGLALGTLENLRPVRAFSSSEIQDSAFVVALV